jgi:AcrR family transcriptional regulator
MKKTNIIQAATRFFASQGFDGTTTKAISDKAGVTEPLLYYHFSGKDEIYTSILDTVFSDYFAQLEVLKNETSTLFEKIENLFVLHFTLVKKTPNEMALILSPKPAKLNDPDNVYTTNTKRHKRWLKSYIGNALKKGIDSGEFNPVQVKETTSIILMMLNEILQKKDYKDSPAMRNSILDFWRRILLV